MAGRSWRRWPTRRWCPRPWPRPWACGRSRAGPLADTLLGALRPKRLLLVLDNCEHLLDACAGLADAPAAGLPAAARPGHQPGGAGHRRRGRLARARRWPLPDARRRPPPAAALTQFEAVRLFVERAVAVQPAFRVTDAERPGRGADLRPAGRHPAGHRAGGRAGARAAAEQMLARLDDRFRLLTGGSRTALPRQQTLRAAVDWSYDLLTGPEQALFAPPLRLRRRLDAGGRRGVCAGDGVDDRTTCSTC